MSPFRNNHPNPFSGLAMCKRHYRLFSRCGLVEALNQIACTALFVCLECFLDPRPDFPLFRNLWRLRVLFKDGGESIGPYFDRIVQAGSMMTVQPRPVFDCSDEGALLLTESFLKLGINTVNVLADNFSLERINMVIVGFALGLHLVPEVAHPLMAF